MKKLVMVAGILLMVIAVIYWINKPSVVYPLPQTASNVDLKKYSGVWYEIALIPNKFEKGCSCTKATYTVINNHIGVKNRCYKEKNHNYTMIKGKAWAVNQDNSKLKVQFFWPFKGDYWILYVDSDYQYALVGGPSRKYLWILAREPKMPDVAHKKLVMIAKDQGFDVERLVKTPHNCK